MRCNKISLKYCKSQSAIPETLIVIDDIPPTVLKQLAKQYNKTIEHEGIAYFFVLDFGDVNLKFRFEGNTDVKMVIEKEKEVNNAADKPTKNS